METGEMIVSVTELVEGDITYQPFTSHPDDVIIIVIARPNMVWPNQTELTYRYLGSGQTTTVSWTNSTPFNRIGNIGVLA